MAGYADEIIFAYGSPAPNLRRRGLSVARTLSRGRDVKVLRLSDKGIPWHPLYVESTAEPKLWHP
jgi:hypothetical protein